MKKNIFRKNKKACLPVRQGFSLVELLVVIAIIIIGSTIALVSLRKGSVKKELETESRGIVAVIQEAKNNALTGKNAGLDCKKYDIKIDTAANTVEAVCSDPSDTPKAGTSNIYSLKNKVTFKSGQTFNYPNPIISFFIPTGQTYSLSTFSIILTKDSQYRYICIDKTGEVHDGDSC
jgi:prepilin-type N-terminal cleavage/methylation domain-containing protein